MIDWITVMLRVSSMPKFDKLVTADFEGNIKTIRDMPAYVESSETSIFVAPYDIDAIMISGNPSKYLQGHNVFALNRFNIVYDFIKKIMEYYQIEKYEIIKITRIDITFSIIMPSELDVQLALSEISNMTAERWGRPVSRNGTQYFGTRQRMQLKCYDKTVEYKRRTKQKLGLPILRFELTLGRKWFEENEWQAIIDDEYRLTLWDTAMNRLRVNELETLNIDNIPRKLQKILGLWQMGVDLRTVYATGTLYNYAKELRSYGIDIWAKPSESTVSQFKRVLQARPMTITDVENLNLPIWQSAA